MPGWEGKIVGWVEDDSAQKLLSHQEPNMAWGNECYEMFPEVKATGIPLTPGLFKLTAASPNSSAEHCFQGVNNAHDV